MIHQVALFLVRMSFHLRSFMLNGYTTSAGRAKLLIDDRKDLELKRCDSIAVLIKLPKGHKLCIQLNPTVI